jgi:hydroxyacylglutathione hydrolase
MIVLANSGGVAMTNCYVVADEVSKEAVLFDAPDHTVLPLLDDVAQRGWRLVGLWLTHGHFDHFADHARVRQRFPDARILIHALDAPKVQNPDLQLRMFGLSFEVPPLKPDAYVSDNDTLSFGALKVNALHTPGHSPGHIAYHFPTAHLLVGGDLIIGGSVGRTDLPDSDHEQLENSVRRVMALPPATRLLGGHGPPTTLAEEREQNRLVRQILEDS